MQVIQTIRKGKLVIGIVSLIAILMIVGCGDWNTPLIQQLMLNLQNRSVEFKPSEPFYGTMTAAFPLDLSPPFFVGYERRTTDEKIMDTLFFHASLSLTQTQGVKDRLQAYAADPFGLGAYDLAGPLRYYQCDTVIVVYQSGWAKGVDPVVDEILTATCEAPFLSYPESK